MTVLTVLERRLLCLHWRKPDIGSLISHEDNAVAQWKADTACKGFEVRVQDPAKAGLSTVQELMNTRRQLRVQQAANKKLQEQVACYERDLEALRSNFSVSQSQASIAKVSTEINSKVALTVRQT